MQVKKQQLELDRKQQTCSKLGKEYIKAVYCHSAYSKLDETQAGIKSARRSINKLRYADNNGRNQRGTKEPLDEGERGE